MKVDYVLTSSGNKFSFAEFSAKNITLRDIAHHLSKIQRCGGAIPLDKYYSVAEHSMIIAQKIFELTGSEKAAKAALLHDAAEAYLGDIVSPLKQFLPDYLEMEYKLTRIIQEKFNVTSAFDKLIKRIDKGILFQEMTQLEIPNVCDNIEAYKVDENIPVILENLNAEEAFEKFIKLSNLLGISDGN
jgi:5'-deoxynucleotidase YfbR-like HD superfamily hydrolase